VGANTTSGDRVNMQGSPLNDTQTLGTQTITNRTATTASVDIGAVITSAAASALGTDAAKITFINNSIIDAINSSQKLSFAAKADALNTLTAITNAYQSSGVTGNTPANFVIDAQKVVGTTAAVSAALPLTLTPPTGTAGATFAPDGNSSNPTNPAIYATTTTLSVKVNIASVGAPGTAGTILGTQTEASGQTLALSAINALDTALTEVNKANAVQGALQNRFSAVISNLTAFSQSQTAAKSRIVDADFAAETAKLSKNQILQQAGTAMLAQANQLPSSVLSLLK
jgi:flagellin